MDGMGDETVKSASWMVAGWLALVLAGDVRPESAVSAARSPVTVRVVASTSNTGSEVLREIDDPATGGLWLLERDRDRPAGPGRLILIRRGAPLTVGKAGNVNPDVPIAAPPVVHAGDLLLVEEHTPVVDAQLEAVAMEPAAKGGILRARLKIGGAVVRVVVQSPGHALFGTVSEVGP